jgi:hypothetical protein
VLSEVIPFVLSEHFPFVLSEVEAPFFFQPKESGHSTSLRANGAA